MNLDHIVWRRPEPKRPSRAMAFHLYRDCHLIRNSGEAEVRERTAEAALGEGRLVCSFCYKRTESRS